MRIFIFKKIFENVFECHICILLEFCYCSDEMLLLISWKICGLSNTTAFIFSNDKFRYFEMRYLKQSSSIDKAFTNCFILPRIICRCRNSMFFLSTYDWCKICGSPGLKSDVGGQFDWNNASHEFYYLTGIFDIAKL